MGERDEPARARPVPFWRHGLAAPPRTLPRVLVECVPWRRAASSARTDSCTSGPLKRAPKTASSSVAVLVPPRILASGIGAHLHDAVARARDRAADQHEVLGGVEPHDRQAFVGHALVAHLARAANALHHACRPGGRADRARGANVVRTVGLGAAAEVVALDRALEALALGGAGDLDLLPHLERLDRDGLPHGQLAGLVAELLDLAVRAGVGLLEVAELGLGDVLLLAGVERELDGLVAVALVRADAGDRAGAGLEHGDALDGAVLEEDLGHAELLGEDRRHGSAEADLDVHARGQMVEALERVDRLGGGLVDVDQPLVRADLEVLARVLVLERGPDDAVDVLLGRQRHGTRHGRAGARRRLDDLLGSRLDGRRVVGLEADADLVLGGCCHCVLGRFVPKAGPLKVGARPLVVSVVLLDLLDDVRHDAGAHRAPTLADGETEAGVHGDRLNQLDLHLDVVTRHHHLDAFGQVCHARDVSGAEVELRPVAREERRVTAALLLLQDVDLGLELRVRRDRAGLAEDLPALDLLALGAAKEAADVVARLTLVQDLAEHLDAGHDRAARIGDADDLDGVTAVDDALLDAAGRDGAAAGDREDVLDRHQERLVEIALGLRDVGVQVLGELDDLRLVVLVALERLERRAGDERDVVAREVVLAQEVTDLDLDELEELVVVDHVGLVEEHDDVGHADLAGEQDVLARLGHGAVSGRDDQDRAIHLGGARDHVLDVVSVAGAVDVRVVTVLRLVLDVRRGDRDPALLLLGRVVDLLETAGLAAVLLGKNLRDGGCQRRLAMVDVTDGPDVDMRLAALELLLGHCGLLLRFSLLGQRWKVAKTLATPPPPDRPAPRRSSRRCWAGLPRSSRTAWCRWRGPGSSTARPSRSRTSPTAGRWPSRRARCRAVPDPRPGRDAG